MVWPTDRHRKERSWKNRKEEEDGRECKERGEEEWKGETKTEDCRGEEDVGKEYEK